MRQEARRRQRMPAAWAANSEAVNGEIVIERTPADVFGSFRNNDRSRQWWLCNSGQWWRLCFCTATCSMRRSVR